MAAQPHDDISFEAWQFGNIVTTGKNTKCIPVNDGISFPVAPPKVQLCTDNDPPLEVVQVSQDGKVRSLVVKVPDGSPLSQSLQALDRFALEAAEKKSMELFKKQFKPEQLLQLYFPTLKSDALLSLTINEDVQVWKLIDDSSKDVSEKKFCDASLEDVVPGAKVWLCAEVKALYFLPRSFGFALATSDILVIPTTKPKVFPFVSRTRSFSYMVATAVSQPSDPEEDEELEG